MSYLDNLSKQYRDATGVRTIDINSKQFLKELHSWTSERQKMGKGYLELLNRIGLYDFSSSYYAEIGKGCIDTIVGDYSTTIITPYTDYMNQIVDERKIVRGYMSVVSEVPVLVIDGVIEKTISDIDTYMTHNPYSPLWIRDWDRLHTSGSFDIIVGAYGKISDRDRNQKTKMIRDLVESIGTLDIKEDYIEYGEYYYTFVGSDRMLLKKEKIDLGGRGL